MSDSQFQLNDVRLEKISAYRSEEKIPNQMGIGIENNEKNYIENKTLNLKIDMDITIEDITFSIVLKANIIVISLEKEVSFKELGLSYGSELVEPLISKASLLISIILSDMIGIPSVIDLASIIDFETGVIVE